MCEEEEEEEKGGGEVWVCRKLLLAPRPLGVYQRDRKVGRLIV